MSDSEEELYSDMPIIQKEGLGDLFVTSKERESLEHINDHDHPSKKEHKLIFATSANIYR